MTAINQPGHPIFLTRADLPELARRCAGPLAADYRVVKAAADAAVARGGIPELADRWHVPADLMNCGLAYLVEREGDRPAGGVPVSDRRAGAPADRSGCR